ncbi:hypothetical protein L249_3770 [Ophiocordyceps polyrhachis-furcata BCC 54312]|uniref:Uncharacterized protein n=1 Tax=Ophiocordyceps polyrhachis-furcata BCC 54312 TaxID=1330021 RepID=A0A367KYV8_9HYPO|nr:hypothetical protein L249_3770 [Ophiocordyceps polyrhachis-furcata BCC 54312]
MAESRDYKSSSQLSALSSQVSGERLLPTQGVIYAQRRKISHHFVGNIIPAGSPPRYTRRRRHILGILFSSTK